jgi:hypothetical protein
MDWLHRKPAMNPLQRNLDQSHHLVRPTDGMELKARTSSLVSRGWISRERNPVAGGVFLLTSFLIERYQAMPQGCAICSHSPQVPSGVTSRYVIDGSIGGGLFPPE